MEQKVKNRRLVVLGTALALCLCVYLGLLLSIQIIHGEDYRTQSISVNTRTETVKGSRGTIVDRNGRTLVTNREVYTLRFDADELNDDALLARAVERAALLCAENGIDWSDTLPLSSGPVFRYTSEAGSSRMNTLEDYLLSKKLISQPLILTGYAASSAQETLRRGDFYAFESEDAPTQRTVLSAQEVFALLRAYYGVDESLDPVTARRVVGMRYAIDRSGGVITLCADADVALLTQVKDGQYDGVIVETDSERQYETDYAAHVLGRIGKIQNIDDYPGYALDALVGLDGVEAAFESELRGQDGKKILTLDDEGRLISERYETEPQSGSTVALTLDIDFQAQVEDILAATTDAMTEEDGLSRGAAAAVVQIGTGDVLALASYPTYSLSTYQQDLAENLSNSLSPFYNRATQGLYAPGSTFKPLTAIAALESGAITPSTKIKTEGLYVYYDMQLKCWLYARNGRNHGTIGVREAIKVSCNYFFYELGRLTGIQTLAEYAAAFGLGESTGIELPELTGNMATPDYVNSLGQGYYWTDGQTLIAAIGQSYSQFTPLQLANYTATLCTGGTRYSTHLLKSVTSADGSSVSEYEPQVVSETPIKKKNLDAVLGGMHDLAQSGSVSKYFESCIVDAAAKTGTAQTGSIEANGVFICFAPFDDPQIAVAVAIEKAGAGSALASAAVDILNAYFTPAESGENARGENMLLK